MLETKICCTFTTLLTMHTCHMKYSWCICFYKNWNHTCMILLSEKQKQKTPENCHRCDGHKIFYLFIFQNTSCSLAELVWWPISDKSWVNHWTWKYNSLMHIYTCTWHTNYTHIMKYTKVYTCMHTHIRAHTRKHARTHTHTHAGMHTHVRTHIFNYKNVYLYML